MPGKSVRINEEFALRLEEVLVWGVKLGWHLTGGPVNFHLTSQGLGFTHPPDKGQPLDIFINPIVLSNDSGIPLLKALILHEIGHHLVHFSDPEFRKAMRKARQARIQNIFNLMEDEHLERRMRSLDAGWGEAFDTLAAYVFKGDPVELLIDQYAHLLGFGSVEEARAALEEGKAAGKVVSWEYGYNITSIPGGLIDGNISDRKFFDKLAAKLRAFESKRGGLKTEWLSYGEFVEKLFDELLKYHPSKSLPLTLVKAKKELMAVVHKRRGTAEGIIECIRDHPAFVYDDETAEWAVRHTFLDLLQPLESETGPQVYINRIRSELAEALAVFPAVKHYLAELEISKKSKWFWNKQRTMLHTMNLGTDFKSGFRVPRKMSRQKLGRILGGDLFVAGRILEELLDIWNPKPELNRERPMKILLAWLEVLAAENTSSYARFMVSLRLGLGKTWLKNDPFASAAMDAVPRGLRKLNIWGVLDVTRDVTGILYKRDGESILDPPRKGKTASRDGRAGTGRGPEEPGAGERGRRSGSRPVPGREEEEADADGSGAGEKGTVPATAKDGTRPEDEPCRKPGKPGPGGGWAPGIAIGDLINKAIERQRMKLRKAADTSEDENLRNTIKKSVRNAEKRIDRWLKTGIDPAVEKTVAPAKMKRRPSPGWVKKISEAPSRIRAGDRTSGLDSDMINIAATCDFNPIQSAVKLPENKADYLALAKSVQRYTRILRRSLMILGERESEVYGMRVGRRLDLARIRRLAISGEPGVLIGSETRPAPDLYIGITIDTSESMNFDGRIDKAKAFAVLILESAKRLPGVDADVTAFTDSMIFRLGGPGDTSIASLQPMGGNNDSAGLLYAAQLALRNPKRRKMLVMISDGYPTECSFESLCRLVEHLESKYNISCAQVAVDSLDSDRIAFPNYTDLSRYNTASAVSHFSRMVQRLIMKRFGL